MYRNTQSKNIRLLFAAMPIALIILFVLFGQLDAPRINAQQEATLTQTRSIDTTAPAATEATIEATEAAQEPAPDIQRRIDEYASITHALQAQTIAAQNPFLAYGLAIEAGRIENPPAETYSSLWSMVYDTRALSTFEITGQFTSTLAVSDDGFTVAALTNQNELVIIDLETRTELNRYLAPRGYIGGADFTPDRSKLIITIPESNLLVVWDLETGRANRIAVGEPFSLVEVSPDGQQLLVASYYTSEVILFDLNTRERVRTVSNYGYSVTQMKFRPDGNTALLGYYDGTIILTDLATGEMIFSIPLGDSWVSAMDFSALGSIAAVGLGNGTMDWIDINQGQVYYHNEFLHSGAINDISFSGDGWRLATAGSDNRITVWDIEFTTLIYELEVSETGVSAVTFNDDDNLISADYSGNITLWNSAVRYAPVNYLNHASSIWATALSDDGLYAATGDGNGEITVWDVRTYDVVFSSSVHTGYIYGLDFSPDGRYLLSGSGDGQAIFWDLTTKQPLLTLAVDQSQIYDVDISPDGKIALLGTWSAGIWLYNIDPESESFGEQLFHIEIPGDSTNNVAFSPDGSSFAAVSGDGELSIWDVETGEQIRVMHSENNIPMRGVMYLPDGERIAVIESGDAVVIRDITSGEVVSRFSIQGNSGGFALSPDEQTLATYSGRNISLWNIETGQIIRQIDNLSSDAITMISFSAAGRRFIVGAVDRVAYLYVLPSVPELINTLLTQRYVPAFTCEQRIAYRIEPYCDAEGDIPASAPLPTLTATAVVTGSIPTFTPLPTSTPPATAVMAANEAEIGTQRGEIEIGGGEIWTYNGTSGEFLTISVTADEPANGNADREGFYDTYLILISPSGDIIAFADDIQDGIVTDSYMEVLLPATGTYQIEVRSWGEQSGGAYTLELGATALTPTPTVPSGG